ncbi:hypothetical protein Zm00014a_021326 [Zea mays]|uniref:ATP-dependent DNA helicase n=1 Tax=Zea mays TaxID=4577 RepID=A0A3L6FCV7_MAIZE|nr:hypothetical protein Zm00014a_021326 [Zea mays]
MDQIGYNAGRTPFTDISNTIITGNQNESNSLGPIVDAKERKRQRDRERYAAMTVEEKNEKNRKRREARQRNKGLSIEPLSSRDGDEQVNLDPDDDNDWLHRNETFQANNIVTSKDLLTPGCVHETVDNIPKHTMKRAAYFSKRYKNMTPVERESRRVRLRLYNKTPRQKDANKECSRKRRALRANTLNQESIAMEDPIYTPEVVRPTTYGIEPYGSSVTTCDWVIPEFVMTPFLPTPTQTKNILSPTKRVSAGMVKQGVDHTHTKPKFISNDDETDEDIEIDGTQDESTTTDLLDLYDKVYSNVPEETHMLKSVPKCGYCTAKKFEYEPPGFCCRGGKVELAPLETPPQLRRLWDSTDSDARHFRDSIRDSGIYTFRAQDMMYRNIKSFGREGGAEHKHLELYFYDDDPNLEHQYQVNLDGMQTYQRLLYPWAKWMHTVRHIGQVMQTMKMQIRRGIFNPILHGKRLFQQFTVDTYIKIESSRLDFIRKNQDRLRADLYQGLVDSMLDGEIRAEKVGKRTVLSPSFIGGPRDMRRRYMDAMALDKIRTELLPGQTPQDRPDLVVRVFHAKLQELKHRLTKHDILGKVRAYIYVVEFQKRGLPHAHFLLIMQRKYKLTCPEQYDLLISAEIPYKKYPELRKMVIKHMMHGPCGSLNPNCPCTKGRASCKNHYPWPFCDATLQGKDSYPIYRRRDDGRKEKVRGYKLDNRWVVPYNPYLLRLFNCHINVEACGSIKAVKYLFKYIYKGHDRASVVMRDASKADDDVDEIKQYRDASCSSIFQTCTWWRFTSAKWSSESSTVQVLIRQCSQHILRQIGYMRRLGASYIVTSLSGTLGRAMPSALRRLFATILVYCEPSDVAVLWRKHLDAMSEDYQRRSQSKTHVEQMVLIDIRNMLQSMGKDIQTFPLPPIINVYDDAIGTAREVYEEESIELASTDMALKDSLNEEQWVAYDKIMSVVNTNQGGLFFVDGPGGTGKTYLYRVLLATLRSQGKIAVATATSGVAASIMPGGRTAHSRFKIPLTIDDGAVCSFTKQSGTAELLQKSSLIIWDEASMTKRQAMEALDNSIQVLHVIRKGSRDQVVASSLRMSYLWESMSHLKLVSNMRAKNDPWFVEYLLRVGGGTEVTNSDGDIRLPDEVCVPYSGSDNDLDNLIDFVFPNPNENMSDSTYITSRAILSTRNDWVDMINAKMIDCFQGEHMVYHSFDSAMDDPYNYYPPEFLNTLTPNGLPPHVLKLKIGCPVILLRNIDPANGLCNGTRLVVRGFQRNSIDAEIVLGQATARSNIKILAIPAVDGKKRSRKGVRKNPTVDCGTYTKNIVYKEALPIPTIDVIEGAALGGGLELGDNLTSSKSNKKVAK